MLERLQETREYEEDSSNLCRWKAPANSGNPPIENDSVRSAVARYDALIKLLVTPDVSEEKRRTATQEFMPWAVIRCPDVTFGVPRRLNLHLDPVPDEWEKLKSDLHGLKVPASGFTDLAPFAWIVVHSKHFEPSYRVLPSMHTLKLDIGSGRLKDRNISAYLLGQSARINHHLINKKIDHTTTEKVTPMIVMAYPLISLDPAGFEAMRKAGKDSERRRDFWAEVERNFKLQFVLVPSHPRYNDLGSSTLLLHQVSEIMLWVQLGNTTIPIDIRIKDNLIEVLVFASDRVSSLFLCDVSG